MWSGGVHKHFAITVCVCVCVCVCVGGGEEGVYERLGSELYPTTDVIFHANRNLKSLCINF